ncbi:hypothetical protein [Sphingobacterium sp. CZ-2]|uniref:hypothetical protein n=1 Tax=Sphingobacterium sp. CZ-2 TaxID=2557994 RepID=UPI0010702EA3|nr:hypothetical protein [Sphingobacterium sp. CZ-2]QBR13257.1 hypothetical protein E3D81_14220 [Sphingobacterium sp. CZ-2]
MKSNPQHSKNTNPQQSKNKDSYQSKNSNPQQSKNKNSQTKGPKKRPNDPNKKFLQHVQDQAQKMAEVLGKKNGEQFIKDALKDYPHLLPFELEKFTKQK